VLKDPPRPLSPHASDLNPKFLFLTTTVCIQNVILKASLIDKYLLQKLVMDVHEEFTNWAIAQGVEINGIAAHKFPGRGLGIIAEKDFKASQLLSIQSCFVVFKFHGT
jgi:hypothetical protein